MHDHHIARSLLAEMGKRH